MGLKVSGGIALGTIIGSLSGAWVGFTGLGLVVGVVLGILAGGCWAIYWSGGGPG